MGTALCKDQADTRPRTVTGVAIGKVNVIGFFLNADSRALQLYCRISGLDYEYVEINMLEGQHQTEEFKSAHPSLHLPIVQDAYQSVYGSTLIQMMHLANRYQKTEEKDRLSMHPNLAKLNNLFATFDQRIRPVTKRIRTMVIARKLGLRPAPTDEQMNREMKEFNDRILPMLNHQLEGKLYFCGQVTTGYDLQVFCEISSIKVFAEEVIAESLVHHTNITNWIKRIELIDDVKELE